jgi:phosphatidylinositol alpha-1,6-mannosyltransferase
VWPAVRERHPDAWLLLVGEGPLEPRLRRRVRDLGADGQVVLGGRVAWEELPAAHAALDLFAMPCRTRWGGLDVEGLGIVYLEAQSSGVPVIAGRSGGAPEAVAGPETGTVVDGRDDLALVAALDGWLSDQDRRRAAVAPAREFAVTRYGWDAIASDLRDLLDEVVAG